MTTKLAPLRFRPPALFPAGARDAAAATALPAADPRFALWAGAVVFALHLVANPHYGFFRDELYFIVCGRHPAAGYVDQPPLIPLIAAATQSLGHSLVALRAASALLAGATVYTACRLAQALGGGRPAEALAAVTTALAPVIANFGTLLEPDDFEVWLWALAALMTLRALRGSPRWWLGVGAALGVASESKYSVAFFAAGLVAGLLLTRAGRRGLATPWLAAGVLAAAALAAPSIVWQAAHQFPILAMLRHQQHGKNVLLTPGQFLLQQLLLQNPLFVIVWLPGLLWSLSRPDTRWIGAGYLLLMALMLALRAKSYYPVPYYPILFACGGAAWEAWSSRWPARRRRGGLSALTAVLAASGLALIPTVVPVLPIPMFVRYKAALQSGATIRAPAMEHHQGGDGPLQLNYSDMQAWPTLAADVARAYHALPAADQARAYVFASNYGEASAIVFFGRRDGLPAGRVLSGHNNYWIWGPRGYDGTQPLVDVAPNLARERREFASVTPAGRFGAPYVMPYENGIPIVIARGLKIPLRRFWTERREFE